MSGYGLCKECGSATFPPILGNGPAKDICYDCKQIAEDDGEIVTGDKARCPKCRHTMSIHDDNSHWYEDGGHDVTCDNCGYDFRIVSSISVSIESPKMLPAPKESPVEVRMEIKRGRGDIFVAVYPVRMLPPEDKRCGTCINYGVTTSECLLPMAGDKLIEVSPEFGRKCECWKAGKITRRGEKDIKCEP
jgi:Zn ribbon nucleic-acid-binding protein